MNRIAILGSGPSGLVAAAAVADGILLGTDADLDIFSLGVKSPLYGAQYLHQPIPDYTDPDDYIDVTYRLVGSADDYREKVYQGSEVPVSVETLEKEHPAWDIRSTYDNLWEDFGDYITPCILNGDTMQDIVDRYDMVLSTIPLPKVCRKSREHKFSNAQIVAAGSAPDLDITLDEFANMCPPETVICNGNHSVPWYRVSNIFGYLTAEFSMNYALFAPNTASVVRKPIGHNCSCWTQPNVHLLGRYGAWKKGVLVHDVYNEVVEILCRTRG